MPSSTIDAMRRYELDGAHLYFDRDTGLHVPVESTRTAEARRRAPRVVQMALTNHCNLACAFCSRDQNAPSTWSNDSAFAFLAAMSEAGTLEVAFGGGEPLVAKGFAELVTRLHAETALAVSLTTNGTLLTPSWLRSVRGRYGQIRLSIYEGEPWRDRARMLSDQHARWGANVLVTPSRVATLADLVLELVELGCPDVLLLSYNGDDRALHLDDSDLADVSLTTRALLGALRGRAELKLDVCWGRRLADVPRAIVADDCGAGVDHIVITSDKKVAPCSFHHVAIPFEDAADVLRIWRLRSAAMRSPTLAAGCAREHDFGLGRWRRRLPLATEGS